MDRYFAIDPIAPRVCDNEMMTGDRCRVLCVGSTWEDAQLIVEALNKLDKDNSPDLAKGVQERFEETPLGIIDHGIDDALHAIAKRAKDGQETREDYRSAHDLHVVACDLLQRLRNVRDGLPLRLEDEVDIITILECGSKLLSRLAAQTKMEESAEIIEQE